MRVQPFIPQLYAWEQGTSREAFEKTIEAYDARLIRLLFGHFQWFMGWSLLSSILSFLLLFQTEGWLWYFFLMHFSWGGINFLLALILRNHTGHSRFKKGNLARRFRIQWHIENMFWLNIGLDTCYILAGCLLWSISYHQGQSHPSLFYGFGLAIVLQGVFLFSIDFLSRWRIYKNGQNLFHVLHGEGGKEM